MSDQEFYVVEDVPLFHEYAGKSQKDSFDAARLAKVVEVNNERASRGEPACLVVGHTDKLNEKPTIGFVDNFKLGERNGLATIFGRYRVYSEQAHKLREYPRRSIEIWNHDLNLPTVALLGGTQPAHDLGLVFSKHDGQLLSFSKEKTTVTGLNTFNKSIGDSMPVEQVLEDAILEVLGKTDVFAFVRSLMDKATADQEAEAPPEAEPEHTEEAPAEETPVVEEEAPEPTEPEEDTEEEDKKDYQKVAEQLEGEKQELLMKYKRAEVEKSLVALKAEGYRFDLEQQVNFSVGLSSDQLPEHLTGLKSYCKKSPVNMLSKIDVAAINKSSAGVNQAELDEIQQYAVSHNMKWKEAETLLRGKK